MPAISEPSPGIDFRAAGSVALPNRVEPGARSPACAPASGVVGWTKVLSPITVRTSRPAGTLGALALARNRTPLASYAPIEVSNNLSICVTVAEISTKSRAPEVSRICAPPPRSQVRVRPNVVLATANRESYWAGVRKWSYCGLDGFCWAVISVCSAAACGSLRPMPICIVCDGLAAPSLAA